MTCKVSSIQLRHGALGSPFLQDYLVWVAYRFSSTSRLRFRFSTLEHQELVCCCLKLFPGGSAYLCLNCRCLRLYNLHCLKCHYYLFLKISVRFDRVHPVIYGTALCYAILVRILKQGPVVFFLLLLFVLLFNYIHISYFEVNETVGICKRESCIDFSPNILSLHLSLPACNVFWLSHSCWHVVMGATALAWHRALLYNPKVRGNRWTQNAVLPSLLVIKPGM